MPRHIPALDGVRGLAILLVIVFHCGKLPAGWLGVDLFFVLSGFLITGILVRAREAPHYFKNFWGRRFLRIFPPYYAYLAVVLLILPALGLLPRPDGWGWVVSYLTNYPLARHGNWGLVPLGTQHLWSVAVEEQFYLVWPVVVWLVAPRRLRVVCVVGILAAIAVRVGLALIQWTALAYAVLPMARMDALLIGAWLALTGWRPSRTAIVLALAVLVAILATNIGANDTGTLTLGYTVIALACGVLLAGAISDPWLARVCSWRWLRLAGTYSYTGYLVHLVLIEQLQDTLHLAAGTWRFTLLVTALTFAIAWASFRWFERPILGLKRYFPEP